MNLKKDLNKTVYNTDNAKGKLLVTVFAFLPAGRQVPLLPRQILNGRYSRTPASARN
jgi:hypothetical protein